MVVTVTIQLMLLRSLYEDALGRACSILKFCTRERRSCRKLLYGMIMSSYEQVDNTDLLIITRLKMEHILRMREDYR